MSWSADTSRFVQFLPRLAEDLGETEAAALRDAPWETLAKAAAVELAEAAPAFAAKNAAVMLCFFDHEGAGHGVFLDGDHNEPAFSDGPVDPASVLECADALAALPEDARHPATVACVYLVAEVLAQNAAALGAHEWVLALIPEHDASPRLVFSSTGEPRSIFDDKGRLIERSVREQVEDAAEDGAELAPLFALVRGTQAMDLLGKTGAVFTRIAKSGDPKAHLAETKLLLSAMAANAVRMGLSAWGSTLEGILANALCCVAGDEEVFAQIYELVPDNVKTPLLAHNLACAAAQQDHDRELVIHWIKRALDLGREPEMVLTDPDLAAFRDDPELRKLATDPNTAALTKALAEAVENHDLAKVKELVEAGADVRGTYDDDLDEVPIVIVALSTRARKAADREARLAVCRYLFERGATIAAENVPWFKVTAPELVELVLDHGVPISEELVTQAVEKGAIPLLERLVARGLDLGAQPAVELLQACRLHDNADTLAWLLARGLDPNATSEREYPALLSYASAGSVPLAEAILAAGAELQARDTGGGSVISHALFNDKDGFVTWAIDRGADLTVVSDDGRGLVALALPSQKCLPILLARGAPVDIADKNGQTALHLAADANNLEAAELLLAAGAKRDVVDGDGKRPADLAKGALKKLLATS
jgi:hypothetical protein